jgi:transcriptional regulator with XRE-family HTH domain
LQEVNAKFCTFSVVPKNGGAILATLYENIKSLCDEHKVSGGKMCLDIGTSKSLMTGLKAGRTKSINAETAKKIADYFGVSVERVLTGEKENAPGPQAESVNEKLLIDLFRQLSPERQQEELAYLAQAAKRGAVQDM